MCYFKNHPGTVAKCNASSVGGEGTAQWPSPIREQAVLCSICWRASKILLCLLKDKAGVLPWPAEKKGWIEMLLINKAYTSRRKCSVCCKSDFTEFQGRISKFGEAESMDLPICDLFISTGLYPAFPYNVEPRGLITLFSPPTPTTTTF